MVGRRRRPCAARHWNAPTRRRSSTGTSTITHLAMAKRKMITKQALDRIERTAKREALKAAGAFDGRFREKVVPNKKRNAPSKKKVDPNDA